MPWSRKALFVNDTDPNNAFRSELQPARDVVPAGTSAVNIDLAAGAPSARATLLSEWNAGAAVIDYFGHGSVEVWTDSGLLSRNDAPQLTNATRLPFVSAMTCLNGYYHDLYTVSLAESLLNAPNGGAIGVFASSSLTVPAAQSAANAALVKTLFAGGTFGEAALAAARTSSSGDFRTSFQLFGDPLLRLRR
jgi:hypothetical protein